MSNNKISNKDFNKTIIMLFLTRFDVQILKFLEFFN